MEERTEVRGGVNDDSGIQTTAGEATWYEPGTLPPRRARTLDAMRQVSGLSTARAYTHAQDGEPIIVGGKKFDAREFEVIASMSREDVERLQDYYETATVSYLKSWTVKRVQDGAVLEMAPPKTTDELLDLPTETYTDLMEKGAEILQAVTSLAVSRTPEGAGDPQSPTVASAQ